MENQELIKKPASVDNAVKLIYVIIAINFLSESVWDLILVFRYDAEIIPTAFSLAFNLVITAAFIYLAIRLSKGQNWVRVLFVLWFILSAFGGVCTGTVTNNPSLNQSIRGFTIVGYAILVLEFIAIVLLFQGESNAYFKAQKQGQIPGSPAKKHPEKIG